MFYRFKVLNFYIAVICSFGPNLMAADLRVKVVGFDNNQGQLLTKLFVEGDNVLGHGHWQEMALIHNAQAFVNFKSLHAGTYALVVVHDTNINGEIDHSALRMPVEQLGFSNHFKLGLFSGLPTFQKLKFEVNEPQTELTVIVR